MVKVLEFGAKWCGPCQKQKPELEKFKAAHPEISVKEFDMEDEADAAEAAKYNVQSLPTFVVLDSAGKPAKFSTGSRKMKDIEELVQGVK